MAATGTNTQPPPGLRVDVAALRRGGVDRHAIEVDLEAIWLRGILADTDADVRDPGHASLDLHLGIDGPIIVSGRVKAHFDVPCGRCLDPARVTGDTDVVATYVLAGSVPKTAKEAEGDDDDGLGLSEDDLDTWTYQGTTLDLCPMVAEYVKVAYPMRALCKRGEACRGLCSNCGAALNEQPLASRCAACGADIGPGDSAPEAGETAADGPMAAALRKLQLPD